MQRSKKFLNKYWSHLLIVAVAVIVIAALMLYRLGSLVSGLSPAEIVVSTTPVGWHGIYTDPFYLLLKLVRSVAFFLTDSPGATITRLPNVLVGAVAVLSFGGIIRYWHGTRTAILATIMFATAAWTLHVSRYASFDVMYLAALPLLLLSKVMLHRLVDQLWAVCLVLVSWGVLLFTPGLIWIVLLSVFWQRRDLAKAWSLHNDVWRRGLIVVSGIIWVIGLLAHFAHKPNSIIEWLGLPQRFTSASDLLYQLAAVPYHLFVQAPAIPELWLASLPLLDLFTAVMTILGTVFYVRNWRASRSRILLSYLIVGSLLIGLGGAVPLSLVVPIVYLLAAAGVSWLLGDWLRTFPLNPVARGLGIGLVGLAVAVSVGYNLRSYFIAWPHNNITEGTTFTDTP